MGRSNNPEIIDQVDAMDRQTAALSDIVGELSILQGNCHSDLMEKLEDIRGAISDASHRRDELMERQVAAIENLTQTLSLAVTHLAPSQWQAEMAQSAYQAVYPSDPVYTT